MESHPQSVWLGQENLCKWDKKHQMNVKVKTSRKKHQGAGSSRAAADSFEFILIGHFMQIWLIKIVPHPQRLCGGMHLIIMSYFIFLMQKLGKFHHT